MFFFLTIYVQTIWGYSPIRAGLAWLPFPMVIIVVSTLVARVLVVRVGVRPLVLAGPLLASVGFLCCRASAPHGSYLAHLLPGQLLVGTGMGLLFVPLTLMVVSHLRDDEAGAASGLFNIGQQIGGSIGLAAIGTIAWTAVAGSVKAQMAAAAVAAQCRRRRRGTGRQRGGLRHEWRPAADRAGQRADPRVLRWPGGRQRRDLRRLPGGAGHHLDRFAAVQLRAAQGSQGAVRRGPGNL